MKTLLQFCLIFFATVSLADANPTLYQAGTILNLENGIYKGSVTFKELTQHGNFGLGTTEDAGGEMVIIDGKPYLGDINGQSKIIPENMMTPFAMVVDFKPTQTYSLDHIQSMDQLEKLIDASLPGNNIFYAIKIQGTFTNIVMRDFSQPSGSSIPLDVWVKENQHILHLKNTSGTMVVFRSPDYINPITVPGYHFHFINSAHTQVGHVYDFAFDHATISIEPLYNYFLMLPKTASFVKSTMKFVSQDKIKKVENALGID